MNTTEFTRKQAIRHLENKVTSRRELARDLAELAFRISREATVIRIQQLELKRLEE